MLLRLLKVLVVLLILSGLIFLFQPSLTQQLFSSAFYSLGSLYYEGKFVPKNEETAFRLWLYAGQTGDWRAQHNLGVMYYLDKGLPQDAPKNPKWSPTHYIDSSCDIPRYTADAISWWRKSAEQGDVDAEYKLGWMYQEGEGVSRDDSETMKWWRMAAENGKAIAQLKYGELLEKGALRTETENESSRDYATAAKDEKAAIVWFKKAADQRLPKAMLALWLAERMLKEVTSSSRDDSDISLLRQAAEAGDADAQEELAGVYSELDFSGMPHDDVEAVKWFRKAAEGGSYRAKQRLVLMLQEKRGEISPHDEDILGWEKEQEPSNAGMMLTPMTREDMLNVIDAANSGDADKLYLAGLSFLNGFPKQDYGKAFKLLKSSADRGYVPAIVYMGILYEKGLGVATNYEEARRWYELASNTTENEAAFRHMLNGEAHIAAMYEYGLGVDMNYNEARNWYLRSTRKFSGSWPLVFDTLFEKEEMLILRP